METSPSSPTPILWTMKTSTFRARVGGLIALTALLAASALAQNAWINEFHYDNSGTDAGEFVEIAASSALTDLAAVRLTLYNGGDGSPYGSSHLLSSFTPGETLSGFTLYYKMIGGLQNGAPDGLSLDLGGNVLDFLSYEGAFLGKGGPADGLWSRDVGVLESETGPAGGSLGLAGGGGGPLDFVWELSGTATPGGINLGQSLIPEPGAASILGLGGLVMWLGRRKRFVRPAASARRDP